MTEGTLDEVLVDLSEKKEITPEAIRRFYKELGEVTETIKAARDALKEAVSDNEEITGIDEEIATLKERRKEIIETNPVLVGYKGELDDATGDRKDLVADAKRDGIPRKEITTAEKMLKGDIDPEVTTEVYLNIADLVG
jgi:predicted  nucleic acid-binding Zn-ribbon protein